MSDEQLREAAQNILTTLGGFADDREPLSQATTDVARAFLAQQAVIDAARDLIEYDDTPTVIENEVCAYCESRLPGHHPACPVQQIRIALIQLDRIQSNKEDGS